MNVASGYFSLGRTACLRSPLLMEEGRAWAEMHRFDCLFDYRDFPGDLSHCEYPFLPHFYLNLPVLSSSWIFSYHVDSGELNAGPDRNGLFERSPLWLKAGLLTESRKRKTPNQPCPYQIPLFYKATAQNGVINNKLDWLNVICVLEFVEKEAQSVQRAQVYWIGLLNHSNMIWESTTIVSMTTLYSVKPLTWNTFKISSDGIKCISNSQGRKNCL